VDFLRAVFDFFFPLTAVVATFQLVVALAGSSVRRARIAGKVIGVAAVLVGGPWLLDWFFEGDAGEAAVRGTVLFVTHFMAYAGGAARGERDGAANAREQTCGAFLSAFNASLPGDLEKPPTVAGAIERLKQREQSRLTGFD
jgi:hypothetical protein